MRRELPICFFYENVHHCLIKYAFYRSKCFIPLTSDDENRLSRCAPTYIAHTTHPDVSACLVTVNHSRASVVLHHSLIYTRSRALSPPLSSLSGARALPTCVDTRTGPVCPLQTAAGGHGVPREAADRGGYSVAPCGG